MSGMTTPSAANLMGGAGAMNLIAPADTFLSASMDFAVGDFGFPDVGSTMGNIDFERDFGSWFNGPSDDLSTM